MSKTMTYPKARAALLAHMQANGYAVSAHLKVPHATTPDGTVRFWFHAQSLHVSTGRFHTHDGARSTFTDIRALSPADTLTSVLAWIATWA